MGYINDKRFSYEYIIRISLIDMCTSWQLYKEIYIYIYIYIDSGDIHMNVVQRKINNVIIINVYETHREDSKSYDEIVNIW